MFSAADNKTHARIRRPVAGAYAMTSIIQVSNLRFMGQPRSSNLEVCSSSRLHVY